MLRRWWPVLLLLLVPLLPLWRAVFLGQAIGEFDHIHHMAPWNGPEPTTPWDVLQADGVLQFYVWRDLVFDAWGKGLLPFWNPYSLAGTPLLANSQSAALYPPHIVLGLLHVPTAFAMVFLAWAHLAWAGLGTYRLVRRMGGSALGGVFAGASFALSPFMIAWTGLPSVITTVSWIPWVLAAVADQFLERTDKHESKGLVALALCTAMLVLSGHLQFVAYGVLSALLLMIGLLLTGRRFKRDPALVSATVSVRGPSGKESEWSADSVAGKAVFALISRPTWAVAKTLLALGLGAMIAAPQLLAVLHYSQFSHRRGSPTSEGYQAYVASAIKPFELIAVPHPGLVGMPTEFAELPEGANLPRMGAYWPVHAKQGANFAEGAVSLGPLILSLLFLAGWRSRWRSLLPIGLVGLLALLLAVGTPLNALLYYLAPGWSATGSPGRIIVLFVLSAAVCAGLVVDRLPELPTSGPKRFLPLLLPLLVTIPFLLLVQLAPTDGASGPLVSYLASAALRNALPALLAGVVLSAIALAVAYHPERRSGQVVLLVTPLLLFLLGGGLNLVRTGDPSFLSSNPLKPFGAHERVAVVNDSWGIAAAAPALAPPNTPAAARTHDLAGYDSLMHRDTVGLLHEVDGQDAAPPANGNMQFVKPSTDPQKLAQAGVTEVWSRKEVPQLGTPAANEYGVFVYRLSGPGRAFTPQGPAEILSETATGVHLRAAGPGRLVLRDRNMPGWLPKIDGKHVPLAGTTWLEVDLEPGTHLVEFNYVAPGFMTGLYLWAIGLVALLVAFLAFRKATPYDYGERTHEIGSK